MSYEFMVSVVFPSALVIGGLVSIFWPGATHGLQTRIEEHPATLNIFRSGRHDSEGRSVPYIGIGMLALGLILFIVHGFG